MAIAENIAELLTYKAYAAATMTANTKATSSSALGATTAQRLRHVSQTLSLRKDRFQANEKRSDRNAAMGRHGTEFVEGQITGLLSCDTYADLFEASLQGTWAAAVTADQSDLTSVSADNSGSTFTFGGGTPTTNPGFRVGDIIRFSGLADADNNSKNFLILSFSGGSNRVLTVYPAPDTMSADTSFSVANVKNLYRPTSSHVSRKLGFEVYNPELDFARLYTECRVGGFEFTGPPNDNDSVTFNIMGRSRENYEASNAPFFTSPTAQTTTKILAGVNGLVRLNGATVGVVTGINFSYAMPLGMPRVRGQTFVPDILVGQAGITGQITTLLDSSDIIDLFDAETEFEILSYATGSEDSNAQAISIYLPRVKLFGANESDGGDLGKIVSSDFEAATYEGSAAGVENTLIRIADTEQA